MICTIVSDASFANHILGPGAMGAYAYEIQSDELTYRESGLVHDATDSTWCELWSVRLAITRAYQTHHKTITRFTIYTDNSDVLRYLSQCESPKYRINPDRIPKRYRHMVDDVITLVGLYGASVRIHKVKGHSNEMPLHEELDRLCRRIRRHHEKVMSK